MCRNEATQSAFCCVYGFCLISNWSLHFTHPNHSVAGNVTTSEYRSKNEAVCEKYQMHICTVNVCDVVTTTANATAHSLSLCLYSLRFFLLDHFCVTLQFELNSQLQVELKSQWTEALCNYYHYYYCLYDTYVVAAQSCYPWDSIAFPVEFRWMHIFKWRIGTLQTDFSWNAHAACRDDRIKVQRTEDNGRKKMLNRKNGKEKCNKNGNEWMEISALTRKNNNIWCALFSDLFPPHCFTELCRAFFCMCRYFSLMSFVCWKISTQSWLFFCRLLLLSISLYTFNVYHIEQLHIVWIKQ